MFVLKWILTNIYIYITDWGKFRTVLKMAYQFWKSISNKLCDFIVNLCTKLNLFLFKKKNKAKISSIYMILLSATFINCDSSKMQHDIISVFVFGYLNQVMSLNPTDILRLWQTWRHISMGSTSSDKVWRHWTQIWRCILNCTIVFAKRNYDLCIKHVLWDLKNIFSIVQHCNIWINETVTNVSVWWLLIWYYMHC